MRGHAWPRREEPPFEAKVSEARIYPKKEEILRLDDLEAVLQ